MDTVAPSSVLMEHFSITKSYLCSRLTQQCQAVCGHALLLGAMHCSYDATGLVGRANEDLVGQDEVMPPLRAMNRAGLLHFKVV